jgi:hypothetical protein
MLYFIIVDNVLLIPDAQDAQDCEQTGAIIWNYLITVITKSIVFRAIQVVQRMSVAPFGTPHSPDIVHLESLLIFSVELSSIEKTKCCSMCTDKEADNRYTQVNTAQKKQQRNDGQGTTAPLFALQKGQLLLISRHLPKEC